VPPPPLLRSATNFSSSSIAFHPLLRLNALLLLLLLLLLPLIQGISHHKMPPIPRKKSNPSNFVLTSFPSKTTFFALAEFHPTIQKFLILSLKITNFCESIQLGKKGI
jgi:hypothetical protein